MQSRLIERLTGSRHIQRRILSKEAIGLKHDTNALHGHDREILNARVMSEAKCCKEVSCNSQRQSAKKGQWNNILCQSTRSSSSTVSFRPAHTSTPSDCLLWFVNSPAAKSSSSWYLVTQIGRVAKRARFAPNEFGCARIIWLGEVCSL